MKSADILPNISALSSLAPASVAIIGLLKGKYKGEWMPYYFILCLVPEYNYLIFRAPLLASWIIVGLILIQLFFFTAHYNNLIDLHKKRLLTGVAIGICLLLLAYDLSNSIGLPYFFPSNSITATSVLIAVFCLSHYVKIFRTPNEVSLFARPHFIFSTGALLFFGGSSLTNYYHNSNVIQRHEWLDELLWQFHAILLILFYSISSFYLWKIRSTNQQ